jgi:carboxyl-terminal processing protease
MALLAIGKTRPEISHIMRKISPILLGAAIGVAVTLTATQSVLRLEGAHATPTYGYHQLSLFGLVFERVRAEYVDKPEPGKLVQFAINGMLSGLDPHSGYMDANSFRNMLVDTRGEFGGIGIEVTMEEGRLKVVAPIDETPAAKAGIMSNDIITHLDNEPLQGLTLDQAVEKMRGRVNSKIKLKIMRKGQDKPIDLSITRDLIRVRSVRFHLEGDDVGFIRVTQFSQQTTDELKRAIRDLTVQSGDKLRGFIVDLRNNPGGLLDQAISVSDAFLEKGEIVSTRGRKPEDIKRYSARPATLPRTSRWLYSSMVAPLRLRRSWQGPSRITAVRRWLGHGHSARHRCRASFRSAKATAR